MTTFDFSADSNSIAMIKALLDKVEWHALSYGDIQKNLVLAQRGIGFILEDLVKQHEIFKSENPEVFGSSKLDSEAVQI